jgi:xanthine dehydrogenase large subunit
LVDRGQIEGGFVAGVGWLTLEELIWDSQGRLSTAGASTYKLPSWSEMPDVFNVQMLERAAQPGVIMGSKAIGEPPLMLAFSVREALREGVAAFAPNLGRHVVRSTARPHRSAFSSPFAAHVPPGKEPRTRKLRTSEPCTMPMTPES